MRKTGNSLIALIQQSKETGTLNTKESFLERERLEVEQASPLTLVHTSWKALAQDEKSGHATNFGRGTELVTRSEEGLHKGGINRRRAIRVSGSAPEHVPVVATCAEIGRAHV